MDGRVLFFPTCLVDAVAPQVGLAACRLLEHLGLEVEVAEAATCCGQPAWNAGHARPAAAVARATLEALASRPGDVVVPAGSCATMIRVFWRELFELEGSAGDREAAEEVAGRTFELAEYVDARGLPAAVEVDATPTVYHRSCHMLRELGIEVQPERLLAQVASDVRVAATDARCCGFGGLFSVKLPEVSTAMADEVLDAYEAAGADQVVGCDSSCLMHLEGRARRRGMGLRFRHLAELLDGGGA